MFNIYIGAAYMLYAAKPTYLNQPIRNEAKFEAKVVTVLIK
jgi:hypothetical protein